MSAAAILGLIAFLFLATAIVCAIVLERGWTTVLDTGLHLYQQHRRTGRRRVVRKSSGGYQPIDRGWIETGHFASRCPPPSIPKTKPNAESFIRSVEKEPRT